MKVLNKLVAVALAGVFAVGCGDDDGGVTMTDLVGTWDASKFEYSDLSGQSASVDIIPFGGAFSITITATSATNGSYVGSLTIPLPPSTTAITGTLELSANGTQITLDDAALGVIVFTDFTTTGKPPTQFIMSTSENIDFDFDQSGTETPASLVVILDKQ